MIGQALAAGLPADMPAEQREAIIAAADQLPLHQLLPLLADAQEARSLLDAGDRAGAGEIIARHREAAVAAGLGEMFDSLFASFAG